MRGDEQIVERLNTVLTNELTAVNQYFLHSRMQRNWGYKHISEHYYHESIDEMKHADRLIHRVLYLGGLPNLQRLNTLRIGETVPEQLELDRQHESEAVDVLREAIALFRSKGDIGSAVLLEDILTSEEEHIDWLDAQLELISQLGATEYLSQQIHEHDD
ncbi:bacterioferritin [Frankia sp. CcI49]|uniref:Bacterioferritin n=1 Tax=Parafrankia irregularis TaxID=795642 RepID=A0A0S4QEX2_9ACTN|nr:MULTISPECIES: bacterioferritin [Frankiaceae]KPM54986.1 bacterioferritin [Frankia sp. R43]MBE3199622.1 bacterioferritin [Parafrankia sp. CH37]ONH56138.1 bacterioferritin [Frankia sp. CcI49]CUU53711.1 bacterioferritin [Parafrankia irregularis]